MRRGCGGRDTGQGWRGQDVSSRAPQLRAKTHSCRRVAHEAKPRGPAEHDAGAGVTATPGGPCGAGGTQPLVPTSLALALGIVVFLSLSRDSPLLLLRFQQGYSSPLCWQTRPRLWDASHPRNLWTSASPIGRDGNVKLGSFSLKRSAGWQSFPLENDSLCF